MIESEVAVCKLLIVNGNQTPKLSFVIKLFNYISNKPFYHFYLRFFCKTRSRKNFDCSDLFSDLPAVQCKTKKKGKFSEYFEPDDITLINEASLDFIIRFGFNIIRGEILNSAKYGVWSFHHGDEQTYRGGPTGFWEIFNDERVNGAILQKLTNKIDAGIVLKKGVFPVIAHSYPSHIDQLLFQTSNWPLSVCKDIMSGNAGYFNDLPASTEAKINLIPGNFNLFLFLVKQIFNRMVFHFKDLFSEEQWNVGIIKTSIIEFIKNQSNKNNVSWIPLKKRHLFNADPFIIFHQEKYHVLYESYDYTTNQGILMKRDFESKHGFSEPEILMTARHHLSYPAVFQHDDSRYLIPEQCETNKVSLYQIDMVNFKPIYIRDLLTGIKAVDTTLFEYDGMFWLFLTRQDEQSNLNLFAYFSQSLHDEFKPHNNNPVKTDITSARPAGNLFKVGEHLYRPTQDSSKLYGGSLKINQIIKLTPDTFIEKEIKHIQPLSGSRYSQGIHTINQCGQYTVIDGKRLIFVWPSFWHKLKNKVLNILS